MDGILPELNKRLTRHLRDFEEVTGKPFDHFYCPILHVDEPVPIQKGHVINEAFKGSPGVWVVQRRDIDSFYGTRMEAEFDAFLCSIGKSRFEHFADKKLFSHFAPVVSISVQGVPYYLLRNGNSVLWPSEGSSWKAAMPRGRVVAPIGPVDGKVICLCLKISPEEFVARGGSKATGVSLDGECRIPALISVVKSAHLSMFAVFGYRYALSEVGRHVGQELLGSFFLANAKKSSKAEVHTAAATHFRPYRHMVRPLRPSEDLPEGTLVDGEVSICADPGGVPWGMIVFVRTGPISQAVLLPFPDNPEAMKQFRRFLEDENRTDLEIMHGKYEFGDRVWRINPQRHPLQWPKSLDSYPPDPPTGVD